MKNKFKGNNILSLEEFLEKTEGDKECYERPLVYLKDGQTLSIQECCEKGFFLVSAPYIINSEPVLLPKNHHSLRFSFHTLSKYIDDCGGICGFWAIKNHFTGIYHYELEDF